MLHAVFALAAVLSGGPARADDGVRLIGVVQVAPETLDTSGLSQPLGRVTQDRFGGWGSAIEWTGVGDNYIVQPDRGPSDGAEEYKCRYVEVTITVRDETTKRATLELGKTVLYTTGKYSLVGLTNVYDAKDPTESLRFDPEGVRLGADGTVYVSDEYGPVIYGFSREGKRTSVVPVPKKFQIARPDAKGVEEDKLNDSGRVANRGFEGLAITPDRKTLWAMAQSPLIQDGGRDGEFIRMLRIDIATGKTAEFVYPLESTHNGCNEVLAVDDHTFAVIERDGDGGNKAAFKKIMLVDVTDATDVSGTERLKKHQLPEGVVPVRKRVLIDLLEERWGLAGSLFPEKEEGLAFGPNRPDGSRTLVITTDNDFRDDQPGCVWVFAVPSEALRFEKAAATAGGGGGAGR
ncbi:MAG: esterase-like activity of phytase family protein [Phycisphaerales bacterium]